MDDQPTATIAPPKPNSWFDRSFELTARSTSVPQELLAGATTFAAMVYIIAVNPSIMSNAGMDRGDLVIATALAAIFGSVMMGVLANLPLAVAPAMGSNVIFTFVIVKQMGAPWQGALAMVAFTGVVFLILSPLQAAREGCQGRARRQSRSASRQQSARSSSSSDCAAPASWFPTSRPISRWAH